MEDQSNFKKFGVFYIILQESIFLVHQRRESRFVETGKRANCDICKKDFYTSKSEGHLQSVECPDRKKFCEIANFILVKEKWNSK